MDIDIPVQRKVKKFEGRLYTECIKCFIPYYSAVLIYGYEERQLIQIELDCEVCGHHPDDEEIAGLLNLLYNPFF